VRPFEGKSLRLPVPFARSAQGGTGACVSAVPVGEQSYQGGVLSSFFQRFGIEAGDPFNVEFRSLMGLRESLISIEVILAHLERKVVQLLRPGRSRGEIESRLAARHLSTIEELLALYEWRDGTDATTGATLDDLHLVPGFYLLSLDDALANHDAFVKKPRWNASWVPILANGGGDFLAVDMSGNPETTPVHHFRIDENEHPIEYKSLANMFATFVAAYEQGVFHVDSHGYLEMDDSAYASLAAALNPGIRWWVE